MSVEEYKRQTVRWMQDRAERDLTQDQESEWMGKLETIWQTLTEMQQADFEVWNAEQHKFRRENGMPSYAQGITEMTPGERAAVQFEGEYDLIVAAGEHSVVFQVNGKELEISRTMLLDYDEEGRFWLSREDAQELGLL